MVSQSLPVRTSVLLASLLVLVTLLPTPAHSAPTGPLQLISQTVNGGGNGESYVEDISDDGRYVVYRSESSGLVPGYVDRNGSGSDIFLYDTETGDTRLVSHIFGSPVSGGLGDSPEARISGDGNYVVYTSVSSDIAQGQQTYDTNNQLDVFLWNRATDETTVVTRPGSNTGPTCTNPPPSPATLPAANQLSISDDGDIIAFSSLCRDLTAPLENNTTADVDVFAYQRSTQSLRGLSQRDATEQTGEGRGGVVSGNGQWVAFYSDNDALAPTDSNGLFDIYRYSIAQDSVLHVSQQTVPGGTAGDSQIPRISDDGTRIAYVSEATGLAGATDTNDALDVFLWVDDGNSIRTLLISQADEPGTPQSGNGNSGAPIISGDGSTVVYATQANNIAEIGNDVGQASLDLLHHRVTLDRAGPSPTDPQGNGTDTLISQNAAGNDGGNGNSFPSNSHAVVSDDGNEVGFLSEATDLALPSGQSDVDNGFDAYLFEIGQPTPRLVSQTATGTQGDDNTENIVVSGDGDTLAIHSLAEDLTDDEYPTNPAVRNVFIQNGPPLGDDLTLSVSDETVTEGPSGSSTPMTFTVSLSQPSSAEITVDYATEDVTTTFGPDYGRRDGTLTFAAGQTAQTVQISVRGDDTAEETETFEFRLSNPSAPATLSPTGAIGIGTILDDDGGLQVTGEGVSDTIFVTTSSNSATALALSQATFGNGTSTPGPDDLPTTTGALIATDGGFADALSSGSLQTDRPLLLTGTDELYPTVIAELERLGVTEVTILGGIVAISQSVEDELRTLGYTVTRYQGPSRLETATAAASLRYPSATTAVLARAFPAQGGPESQAFADSLAAGALAADNGWPLILTQSEVLSTSTRNYIDTSQLETIYVVGGEAAISDTVIDGIAEFAIETIRLSGPSRFETALAIAGQRGYQSEGDAGRVMLLDGTADNAWAAGFAGAAHSAVNGAPVVLAAADQVPATTRDWLAGMMMPSEPRFAVDEDNVTEPVLVCAIADSRCLESRITLGLPELGETALSRPDAARGETLSMGVTVQESATVNVTGSCLNPSSAMPITSGTTPVEISVPGEANQGPCAVTTAIDFPNGTRHTLVDILTVTP